MFSISGIRRQPPPSDCPRRTSTRRSASTKPAGRSRAAHQLGLHGVLAPAATGLGETFAIFEEHLAPDELPRLVDEEVWDSLPADPRRLRAVRDEDAS